MPMIQPDLSVFQTIAGPLRQAQTPADWEANALKREALEANARQQAAEERKAAAAAEKAAQEMRDLAQVRELGAKYNGDLDKIAEELHRVNPAYGVKFGKEVGDWRTATFNGIKAEEHGRQGSARAEPHLVGSLARQPGRLPDRAGPRPQGRPRDGGTPARAVRPRRYRARAQDGVDRQGHLRAARPVGAVGAGGQVAPGRRHGVRRPENDTKEEWDAEKVAMRRPGGAPVRA